MYEQAIHYAIVLALAAAVFMFHGCVQDLWLVLQQRRPVRVLSSTRGPSHTDMWSD